MDSLFIFGAEYLWLLALIPIFYVFWKKEIEFKRSDLRPLLFPLSYILAIIARSLYFNPRPFVVEGFKPLIDHAADNGFPSDHVLLMASTAVFLSLVNRKWAIVIWIATLLVAVSRVYVGVHHTLDVVASIVISLISGGVIYFSYKSKINAPARADIEQ